MKFKTEEGVILKVGTPIAVPLLTYLIHKYSYCHDTYTLETISYAITNPYPLGLSLLQDDDEGFSFEKIKELSLLAEELAQRLRDSVPTLSIDAEMEKRS